MNIIISNASGLPIYEQIYAQIKTCIISDELKDGDALPSMRVLAKNLRISVITTKRAYEELEQDGYIETVPGKGSFVASKNLELIREEQLQKIEGHMLQVIELSAMCKLSKEELLEMLELMYDEGDTI